MRSPNAVLPASPVSLGAFASQVLAAALLAVFACGCARNGDFEISLTLPPRPPGASDDLYAVAMFLGGDFDFTSVSIDAPYEGVLLTDMPQQLRFSVLSERADGHVRMIVYFCASPTCASEDPSTLPQAWFDFERAVYVGHLTRWTGEIAAVPAGRPVTATCVDRCEVEGCIEGLGWFCREDGSHYCQERGADPGAEVCDP